MPVGRRGVKEGDEVIQVMEVMRMMKPEMLELRWKAVASKALLRRESSRWTEQFRI